MSFARFASSPTVLLGAVVAILSTTITFVYAWNQEHSQDSNTSYAFQQETIIDSDEVSWPGVSWLLNLAEDKSNSVFYNDKIYSSAYEAFLESNPASNPVRNFNAFINSIFVSHYFAKLALENFGHLWGHYILCYFRNIIGAMIIYYGTAGVFHYHCYIHPRSKDIFSDRERPSNAIIWNQIQLAQSSIFLYVLLPVVAEYIVEEGYTKCYYNISDIGGWVPYISYTLLYFTLVEIAIYWMHRILHTNKTLYKYIHMMHHQYSKPETLTPWASIAFHPLDGMLQACPYVLCLPIVPCHYISHLIMFSSTAIWATYIHDSMDWNIDPIMGSKYHTIHHTHYVYNYGQIFTFCDSLWGTLRVPVGKTGVRKGPNKFRLLPAQQGLFGSGRGGKSA